MPDRSQRDLSLRPTRETYDALETAYDRLNWALFDGELPTCLFTYQRRGRTYGYFSPDRFGNRDGQETDEIALNPAHFRERTAAEVLATLGHEMAHLWQHHFGKRVKRGYHSRQWADKMKEIGLQPTSTGEEGGRETGYKMSHIIVPGGPFDRTASELIAGGFAIAWLEIPQIRAASTQVPGADEEEEPEAKSGQRVKYTCPACGLNAWAKHGARVDCHEHKVLLEPA